MNMNTCCRAPSPRQLICCQFRTRRHLLVVLSTAAGYPAAVGFHSSAASSSLPPGSTQSAASSWACRRLPLRSVSSLATVCMNKHSAHQHGCASGLTESIASTQCVPTSSLWALQVGCSGRSRGHPGTLAGRACCCFSWCRCCPGRSCRQPMVTAADASVLAADRPTASTANAATVPPATLFHTPAARG